MLLFMSMCEKFQTTSTTDKEIEKFQVPHTKEQGKELLCQGIM